MKKIAVTQRLTKDGKHRELRNSLDIRWVELLGVLNYLPIILPTACDFKQYFESFKISGIILTGGGDLSVVSQSSLSVKRDEFEKNLIDFVIKKKIPIFGVCRGMQIIADYFKCRFKKVDGHIGTRHRLAVSEKSEFKTQLKKIRAVNSYHYYAVKNIMNGLIVSAMSEEGTIEALEHVKYRIFGQMWHSERESPFSREELDVIRKLFK